MALTKYTGSKPQRNDRSTFSVYMDSFITWFLDTFMAEIDAVVDTLNLNDTTDTSDTSNTIAEAGTLTFTVSAGKSFVPGMWLVIADTAEPQNNQMTGIVVSYSGTTLQFAPQSMRGSGTKTAWHISFSVNTDNAVSDSEVYGVDMNGHGSTNDKIMRIGSIIRNIGPAITYLDDPADGASFTINKTALYAITLSNVRSGGPSILGVSVNSSQLTTAIASINDADRILVFSTNATGQEASRSITLKLNAGDVLRIHTDGLPDGSHLSSNFRIVLVGNVL